MRMGIRGQSVANQPEDPVCGREGHGGTFGEAVGGGGRRDLSHRGMQTSIEQEQTELTEKIAWD